MQATLLTVGLAVVPLVLVLLLRASVAAIFAALTMGQLFVSVLDKDVAGFTSSFFGGSATNTSTLSLLIVLAAIIVASIGFRNAVAKSGIVLHALLAVAVGIVLVVVLVDYLPADFATNIRISSLYKTMHAYTSVAVASSAIGSMLLFWASRPKHHVEKHHSKHGH